VLHAYLLPLTPAFICTFPQANSSLTSLNLHGCKRISDKGLSAVSNLPLKALSLGLTRVKDEGMAYLARLTQLTELHCTNEELTDEGIHHLSSLTDLNTLALRDCCEVSGDALLVSLRGKTAIDKRVVLCLCDACGSGLLLLGGISGIFWAGCTAVVGCVLRGGRQRQAAAALRYGPCTSLQCCLVWTCSPTHQLYCASRKLLFAPLASLLMLLRGCCVHCNCACRRCCRRCRTWRT
jgi:hypothetical protein